MAKLCRAYRPPPKLCAIESKMLCTDKNGWKKRTKNRRSRQQRTNRRWRRQRRQRKRTPKKLLLMLSVTAAHHPAQTISISFSRLTIVHSQQKHRIFLKFFSIFFFLILFCIWYVCVGLYVYMVCVCVCVCVDSSFCYFQTRISFRNTICIFEHRAPQCQPWSY